MDEPSDEPDLCEKIKTGTESGRLHIKIPGSSGWFIRFITWGGDLSPREYPPSYGRTDCARKIYPDSFHACVIYRNHVVMTSHAILSSDGHHLILSPFRYELSSSSLGETIFPGADLDVNLTNSSNVTHSTSAFPVFHLDRTSS